MNQVKRKQLPQDGTVLLRTNALKFNLALLDQSLARDSLAEFVRQAWHIVEPTCTVRKLSSRPIKPGFRAR